MKVCSFCNSDTEKLVKSHIIPESFYKYSLELAGDEPNSAKMISNKDYPKRSKNGIYEEFICLLCESQFGEWDDYALQFFKKIIALEFKNLLYQDVYNYNYEKIKLFFISLLWRADACKKQEMFKNVDIGVYHRNKCIEMIRNRDAGDWQDYAVFIQKYKDSSIKALWSPIKFKMPFNSNLNFYKFYMLGFEILIKCDKQNNIPINQEIYYLKKNSITRIPSIPFKRSIESQKIKNVTEIDKNIKAFSRLSI